MNIQFLNLKILAEAIREHTSIPVDYANETKIIIKGVPVEFSGNLVKSAILTTRFNTLKSLLFDLQANHILPVNANTIYHILNRYRHLESESKALQALINNGKYKVSYEHKSKS